MDLGDLYSFAVEMVEEYEISYRKYRMPYLPNNQMTSP